jgi:hypothetical protein
MFDRSEFLGAAPVCSRLCSQQTPHEGRSMGTPPSGYSTSVAIPLPTDDGRFTRWFITAGPLETESVL